MRRVLLTRLAVAVAAVAAAGVLSAPVIASAASPNHAASHAARAAQPARPTLPAGERYVCPPAPTGQMTCMSIITPTAISLNAMATAAQASRPFRPVDLRKAYKIVTYASRRGRGRTVAIVDAYSNPHAAADLARYRKHFGLPGYSRASGCLHIFHQKGASKPLPAENKGWAIEEILDLDMVSAICPHCRIDLIEAKSAANANLGIAEDTAARKARYISNSWGNSEFQAETGENHFFKHPGHVVDFASGDLGYGSTFPASLSFVTAVGGTTLKHSANKRGFSESVWGTAANSPREGTASGCSKFEAKPSWQRKNGKLRRCGHRVENDVSAAANPNPGVVIYTSVGVPKPGFYRIGGTSAATPIITAVYALARHLFDVTTGVNGRCGTRTFLCHGERGFDGPTGLGTPDGVKGFHAR